ncbi:dephospho-CoA kinase [Brevibacterium senegalense]|uniref:dephospho-CoA kinase n=1 Tax=Brevibacterium senegalense TaxID=1033736 RepID=UPI000370A27E|nr:dephospho-CoA kinase [Brevibacterium senegalense]
MTETHAPTSPLLLGLTGGIGAGKSTVAALLADRGAGIVDADRIAREVVEPGEPALEALRREFGDAVLAVDGALDRAALAGLAFATPERTAALNAIMHPAIAQRTAARLAEHAHLPVVVHDVPLLVENGMTGNYHLSLLVDVPEETRLERLTTSRGLDREDAQRRIRAQATDAQRHLACDTALDNAGTQEHLRAQVARLWEDRIEPFRRNRAAGIPARPLPLTGTEAGEEAQRAAGARLVARLERTAGRAGVPATASASPAADGVAIDLRVPAGTDPEAVGALLRDAGYAPRDDRWLTTDPGRPATVTVSAGTR